MWPPPLGKRLNEYIPAIVPLTFSRLSGGDINDVWLVETASDTYVLKVNDHNRFPGMLAAEAKGLNYLSGQSDFVVPEVIAQGTCDASQYLLLSFLPSAVPTPDFWSVFGNSLAGLHRCSSPFFGLPENNYIGSLPQINTPCDKWENFYSEFRLLPLAQKAFDKGLLPMRTVRELEGICQHLGDIFPQEVPALLHGDLWSGNFLVTGSGVPALIDPAVYFGHREMDLGMTLLFGGFRPAFYDAYQDSFPLEKEWKSRIRLCQLYPILVHVHLFGGHYAHTATEIISAYH